MIETPKPGSIVAVVDDLFFAAKIRAAGEGSGVTVRFAKTLDLVIAAIESEKPSLVIADLHAGRCNPIELAQRLKADDRWRDIPLIGFFSHVHAELERQARAAGFDRTLTNSMLAAALPELLKS
jgi:CheY-like chemotaxis protein